MANPESNVYAGGINFSSTIGNNIETQINFDLPLATVSAFNNQALNFLSANSQRNTGFLTQHIGQAQSGVDVARGATLGFLNRGLNLMQGNFAQSAELAMFTTQQSFALANKAQNLAADQNKYIVQKSKGWCFVTTAICAAENKPDDCPELEILRAFRDGVMMKTPEGFELVRRYYRLSPALVKRIKNAPDNGRALLARLRRQYLMPAIHQILKGDHSGAIETYRQMLEYAEIRVGA